MILTIIAFLKMMLIVLASVLFAFFMVPLFFYGAPFLPSYRRQKRKILEPLFELARSAPGNKFIDLGSGDGRVVMEFARRGFDSWGVEFNPALVLWSRWQIKLAGFKNARIIKKNFWKIDLASFDIVYNLPTDFGQRPVGRQVQKRTKTRCHYHQRRILSAQL